MDRTLSLGYVQGSCILFSLLLISLAVWFYKEKNLEVYPIFEKRKEVFYWITVLFSNSLGTAFQDFLSDNMGLSYMGGALVCIAIIIVVILLHYFSRINQIVLFFLISFCIHASIWGDFRGLVNKTCVAKGGFLILGTLNASLVTASLLGLILIYTTCKSRNKTA